MPLNNTGLYDAVIAGIALSNGAWASETNASDYAPEANAAVAIATEVDTNIPTIVGGATVSQRSLMLNVTKGCMSGRTPTSVSPTDYAAISNGIVAVYTEFASKLENNATTSGPFPVITSAIGAVDGDILRNSGIVAGVYLPAQANSNLNAAAVVGVKEGTLVIPFSECPIVNFDSSPIVGQPCYLSATTAGKLTSNVPGPGSISIPIGLIVQENTSSGGVFTAQVAESASLVQQLSLKEQFISNAATTMGLVPNSLHSELYDFNTLAVTGLPPIGVPFQVIPPTATHFGTTPPHSRIAFSGNNGGGGYAGWVTNLATPADPTALNILQNTSLANQYWSMRIKFRQTILANTLKFWSDKGAGNETIGIGLVTVGGVNSFYALFGNFNPLIADPTSAQRTLLIPEDTVDHIATFTSLENGTMILAFDSLPSLTIPLPATASPTIPEFLFVSTVAEIDYWMICAP